MLTILGGRGYFWQWDTGQQLLVQDTTCGEVHFCNGTDDCALVVPIKTTKDGARVADVPNILLQTAKPVSAYLYRRDDNGAETRTLYRFQVLARSKPEDYVYTETEVLTYATLDRRIKDLEEKGVSPDQIAAAVDEYLKENPGGVGATPELSIGTVNTLPAGSKASVDITGTAEAPVLNFGIPQGPAGYTPGKGTDYWTPDDQQSIVNDVLAALPTWEGGSY